ncbi:MAG: aspartyl protease family protein [Candidatus Acidiferrales bacterium]
MRIQRGGLMFVSAALVWLFAVPSLRAQTPPSESEIPLQRCDRLPVAIVEVNKVTKRFLVDTAATSMLNQKSFKSGHSTEVRVQSWNKTISLSAREVVVNELSLGGHHLQNLKLPAIDLSAIAKACGGPIDGILGVDLLEQLGVTIDLQRSVARLGVPPPNSSELSLIADMERSMQDCSDAFNDADAVGLSFCFDRDFVLSLPEAEYRGRDQAANYFREQYFKMRPHVRMSMTMNDQRVVGDIVWSSYDYTLESPAFHFAGRGMMLCHKSENRWYILSMHESPTTTSAIPKH